ncbi:MAG: metallophosphoesterase family protein [Planctomycetota bacterium]|nr:metallophosphoesterase family protein [Planctomycetota bacterium]
MKLALLSDIHSNLEALDAVMVDISRRGVQRIAFLGDIVGYGPDPKECLSYSRIFSFMILGNHDDAILYDSSETFNKRAKVAIKWTKEELEKDRDFVEHIKKNFVEYHEEEGMLFCHGSPLEHTRDYVFPDLGYDMDKVYDIFGALDWVCFCGHTHHPGVLIPNGEFYYPDEIDYYYRLGKKKAVINVGSVGQPRDGDKRACYAILDDDVVEWIRVPYNYQKTQKKILATNILDPFLAKRLASGK